MNSGKYRRRTFVREHLPRPLAALIPKGRNDCGNHEWYKSEESTWLCYHCEVGVTHQVPWDERELAARQLEAGAMEIRAGIRRPSRPVAPH